MTSWLRPFGLLLAFRLVSILVVRSWFVADELFQSVEVAHHLVFGSGILSWEWTVALRSSLHPILISAPFWLLSQFGLSTQFLIVLVPRLMHATLIALSDYFFINLSRRLLPSTSAAFYACAMYFASWFMFYCAPRTLGNSLETALTVIALHWYPFEEHPRRPTWPYISLGVLTIILRPTAALIWVVFGLAHLYRSEDKLKLLLGTVLPAALPVFILSLIIDTLYFGRLTLPLYNFLEFNVLTGGSAHFGVHSWHWYFSSGLPSVLTVQLIPVVLGIAHPLRPTLLPLMASLFYTIFHSFLPHKEQRFLLPLIPLLCLYAGPFLAAHSRQKLRLLLVYVIVVVNVVVALYTGLYHQVGPYAAAEFIVDDVTRDSPARVTALIPCFSMPGYGYFHDKVSHIRMLDCAPDLNATGRVPESDVFHANPEEWIRANYGEVKASTHLVIYDKYWRRLEVMLLNLGLHLCARFHHAHALTSSNEDHWIVVACKGGGS